MVNKAALGVLGVIVLVSMGVGVLIGMQLGGSGAAVGGGNGSTDDGDGPTPVPVTTGSTPTPLPTAGPTPDSSPATETATGETTIALPDRTTVPSRRFSEDEIAQHVKELVNERRTQQGLRELTIQGQTVDQIDRMALGNSVRMADAGVLSHNIEGNSSEDRYRMNNLYATCQFASDQGSYLITAESNNLEVITRTFAGRAYEDDGQARFNENETQVAQAIVENWFDGMISRPRLLYSNAERIGVGVEVTQDGTVYATGDMC